MGKMKKIRLCIGILAFALMMPMSGCSVSISFGTNKDTEAEKETEEKTEKKTETEKQEEKTVEPAEATVTPTPTPEPVQEKAVSAAEPVQEKAVPTPEPEVKEQPAAESVQQKTPQYVTYYVVNCKQSITLRPGPDVNSGEICQIPLGAAVSYIESAENGFYKINYNGKTGYSLASYLSTSKPSAGASYVPAPAQMTTYGYETYYVVNCKQSITLRTSPSTEAGEICQIPLGAAVSYISAASNGFYYISYNGNTGYALASYLSSSYGSSYYDTCRVVNCKQSITLRPGPDVNSGEICQIPLGATVSFVGTAANDFYEIYYMGNHGYALASYLEFQ